MPQVKEDSQIEAQPQAAARDRRWLFLAVVVVVWVVADQVTKFWALGALTPAFKDAQAVTFGAQLDVFLEKLKLMGRAYPPETFIPAFWSWRYAENPGAAWSFAAGWDENVRVPFFHFVSIAAVVLIGYYYRKLERNQRLLQVALALVAGGALGNLIDRLARGYVIDFIDWHLADPNWLHPARHWPTFNVADTGISVGVALIFLDALLGWLAQRKAARAEARSAA